MKPSHAGPVLVVVVFGAAFTLVAALIAAVVIGASPSGTPDAAARMQWMLAGVVAGVLAGAAFFGTVFRLSFAEQRLGHPELQFVPEEPVEGSSWSVRVRFTPRTTLRLGRCWAQLEVGAAPVRVPFEPELRELEADEFVELRAAVPVPEGTAGAHAVLTVYVEIAWWPDWRADVPVAIARAL